MYLTFLTKSFFPVNNNDTHRALLHTKVFFQESFPLRLIHQTRNGMVAEGRLGHYVVHFISQSHGQIRFLSAA